MRELHVFKLICQTLQCAVSFPESEYRPVRFAGLVRRVGSGIYRDYDVNFSQEILSSRVKEMVTDF